jgi:hypothetical protein
VQSFDGTHEPLEQQSLELIENNPGHQSLTDKRVPKEPQPQGNTPPLLSANAIGIHKQHPPLDHRPAQSSDGKHALPDVLPPGDTFSPKSISTLNTGPSAKQEGPIDNSTRITGNDSVSPEPQLKRRSVSQNHMHGNEGAAAPLHYTMCPLSTYNVPGIGALLTMQRGESPACAVYLSPAPFARRSVALPPSQEGALQPTPVVLAAAVRAALADLNAHHVSTKPAEPSPWHSSAVPIPADIYQWPQVRMEQVGNLVQGSAALAAVPQYDALLRSNAFRAAAEMFAQEAACLLQATGLPWDSKAVSTERVLAWPQVLSYASASEMPTGREGALSGALLRGVYAVDGASKLQMVFFDPRAPLDAVEPQDSVNDMYR